MGLIVKDKIQALLKGYPTVSDKYNVQGGVCTENAKFGDVLKFTDTDGVYAVATGVTKAEEVAGILLATNAKTPHEYPAEDPITVVAGEAINLLICGYVAVPVAKDAAIKPGLGVAITTEGVLTIAGTAGAVELTGWEFTGTKENEGTDSAIAEIVIK